MIRISQVSIFVDLIYPLSGLLVGLVVGLTGMGGGALMTPLLVLAFGVAPATAVGTDLLFAAITKTGGAIAHTRHRTVHWRIVGLLAAGSVPAAVVTVTVLQQFGGHTSALNNLLTTMLGLVLIITALGLILKGFIQRRLRRTADGAEHSPSYSAPATIIIGAIIGVLVTLTSVGAGVLGTLALLFLYPQLPVSRIVGTDITHAVPLTLVAGLGHAALGTIDYTLLGYLLLGSLPGIWIGSHFSARLPEHYLRPALPGSRRCG
jgi:uncharacterized membrane protein YfcA